MKLRPPYWKKGKTYKRPYSKSKSFDVSCRNHGACSRCRDGRLYQARKALKSWYLDLKDYLNEI